MRLMEHARQRKKGIKMIFTAYAYRHPICRTKVQTRSGNIVASGSAVGTESYGYYCSISRDYGYGSMVGFWDLLRCTLSNTVVSRSSGRWGTK